MVKRICQVLSEIQIIVLVPTRGEGERLWRTVASLFDALKDPLILICHNGQEPLNVLMQQGSDTGKRCIGVDARSQRGKGWAIRCGLRHLNSYYDKHSSNVRESILAIHDADGEYQAGDVAEMMFAMIQTQADWAVGSRFSGASRRLPGHLTTKLANQILTLGLNMRTNRDYTDAMCGVKIMRWSCYEKLRRNYVTKDETGFSEDGFGFDIEWMLKCLGISRRGLECPVTYLAREWDEGKKIRWYHFLVCLKVLLKSYAKYL